MGQKEGEREVKRGEGRREEEMGREGKYAIRVWDKRALDVPGAVVTGSCELQKWVPGAHSGFLRRAQWFKLRSSKREVLVPNC